MSVILSYVISLAVLTPSSRPLCVPAVSIAPQYSTHVLEDSAKFYGCQLILEANSLAFTTGRNGLGSPTCAQYCGTTQSNFLISLYNYICSVVYQWIPRTAGAYPGFSEGGGGLPRSAKEANKPKKRASELKPRTCAHQGSIFRPYTSVCFVESSICMALV